MQPTSRRRPAIKANRRHITSDANPPALEFAFEARVSVSPALEGGLAHANSRRVIPITGGIAEGPRLTGRVVPGGADWKIVYADGAIDLIARYTIEATEAP